MATREPKKTSDLSQQAIALAERLGRIAGTFEGTAESLMNRQNLTEQLTRVRDGAAEMLETLNSGARKGSQTALRVVGLGRSRKKATRRKAQASVRRADLAHAQGKRHRKPAPTLRGVKKSDATIPKMKTAAAARRRRKSYA